MESVVRLTVEQIRNMSEAALTSSGASQTAASSLARAVAAAEHDGIASHGLAYVPTYCQHLKCGKVNKDARPVATIDGATIRVDADSGFAHPAIDLGFQQLVPLAHEFGIASLALYNSYNAGVLGFHTEALALKGLVALGFTNSPASIAPWGGRKPLLGTNPWSLAVPGSNGTATLVIDQSASVVAKSEIMKRQREGRQLPDGWAFDRDGQPTTVPETALAGTMVPAGGYKGVGSALLVEVFAACLTGATLGVDAAPFSGIVGGPPCTGQFFIAIAPAKTSGGSFEERMSSLAKAFAENEGARMPGSRRFAARSRFDEEPIEVSIALYEQILEISGQASQNLNV